MTITTSTNTSGVTKTYTSDTDNAKYDISGTGRKGKWIQMEITNSSNDIESIGIIYRKRTSVK